MAEYKHLGLRLSPHIGLLLDALMADEQKRVGELATVSYGSLVTGLIVQEVERRGLAAKAQK